MSDNIPDWAIERACQLANARTLAPYQLWEPRDFATNGAFAALARYISEHEQPPTDPLLIEARKIVECTVHWSPQTDRDIQSGKNDGTGEVKIALAALRRGIEIATGGEE